MALPFSVNPPSLVRVMRATPASKADGFEFDPHTFRTGKSIWFLRSALGRACAVIPATDTPRRREKKKTPYNIQLTAVAEKKHAFQNARMKRVHETASGATSGQRAVDCRPLVLRRSRHAQRGAQTTADLLREINGNKRREAARPENGQDQKQFIGGIYTRERRNLTPHVLDEARRKASATAAAETNAGSSANTDAESQV